MSYRLLVYVIVVLLFVIAVRFVFVVFASRRVFVVLLVYCTYCLLVYVIAVLLLLVRLLCLFWLPRGGGFSGVPAPLSAEALRARDPSEYAHAASCESPEDGS